MEATYGKQAARLFAGAIRAVVAGLAEGVGPLSSVQREQGALANRIASFFGLPQQTQVAFAATALVAPMLHGPADGAGKLGLRNLFGHGDQASWR